MNFDELETGYATVWQAYRRAKESPRRFMDAIPKPAERNAMWRYVRETARAGQIANDEQFRHLEDDIWEFRTSNHRLFCWKLDEKTFVLTHGLPKKEVVTKKQYQQEIARAKGVKAEWDARKDEEQ